MEEREREQAIGIERFAGAYERWVCPKCGRYTGLGGDRWALKDTSCITHAVRCYGEKNKDGDWVAVEERSP